MMKRTILSLFQQKKDKIKAVGITSYDYPFSKIINSTDVDFIVVGDTVGSTVYGEDNLNKVTMETMLRHCEAVAKGSTQQFLIGDMPYMSYQGCTKKAIENAGKFIIQGMDAVKIEGFMPDTIHSVNNSGTLVMAHLGLTPQTRARLGGYKIQAKTSETIRKLVEQCKTVESSGASLLLLEAVPDDVGKIISSELNIPVYGIGAGNKLDGQLVILHDILGMFWKFKPKFVKQYINGEKMIGDTIAQYSKDVKNLKFPSNEYFYNLDPNELEKYLTSKHWKHDKT